MAGVAEPCIGQTDQPEEHPSERLPQRLTTRPCRCSPCSLRWPTGANCVRRRRRSLKENEDLWVNTNGVSWFEFIHHIHLNWDPPRLDPAPNALFPDRPPPPEARQMDPFFRRSSSQRTLEALTECRGYLPWITLSLFVISVHSGSYSERNQALQLSTSL